MCSQVIELFTGELLIKKEIVSIIVPVYNNERYLQQALNSIIAQSFTQWHCIIIDDCSNDNSPAIIQDYCLKDKRFSSICTHKRSGPALTRNLGIAQAKGRYLCFLDSDDYWYPAKIERQLAFVTEYDCAISYSAFDRVDAKGTLIRYQPTKSSTDYQCTLYNNLLNTCSVMLDRKKLLDISFPENVGHEDLGLWLKLLKQVPKAYGLEESLLAYRIHQQSRNLSIAKRFAHQWQIYLSQEKLPLHQALRLFVKHTVVGFQKRRLEGILARANKYSNLQNKS